MKKAFLLAVSIFISFFSFGQTIPLDSFYAPGASWTEVVITDISPCSAGRIEDTIGIVYKIERDSIISGKTYHLVSSCNKGGYGHSVVCSSGVTTFGAYIGLYDSPQPIFAMIRTDSNRVYFTLLVFEGDPSADYECDTTATEYLFYNFNFIIDSVLPTNFLGGGIAVPPIDSVSLSNGINVPRYYGSLIYGIGSEGGFINYWHLNTCGPGPNVTDQYLLCYDNPHFYYHFNYPPGKLRGNLQNDCFDMAAYLNVPSANTPSTASLYPNPATTSLTVSSPQNVTRIAISNLLGETVYRNEYNSQQVQVDVSALPAGVYFVKVNGTEVRKFVKE